MPTVSISFQFKPSADTLKYAAYIDDQALTILNGNANATLQSNVEHILTWFMWGNSGDKLDFFAAKGEQQLLSKSSTVPAGKQKGAGYVRFLP